ncbi:MAG: hypothetical protein ACRDJW_05940 [Thermomicrobiales bacterium]
MTMRHLSLGVRPAHTEITAPRAVQRYEEVSTAAYAGLPGNAGAGGGPTFSAQKLTVKAGKQIVKPLQNPDLKVADKGDLAIAVAPQPKEFYADQAVLAASNSKLESVGSPLRLVGSGTSLTVPVPGLGNQTKQLQLVQPTMAGPGGLAALSDKCNEIAAVVMGKQNVTEEKAEAIFQSQGGGSVKSMKLDFRGGAHSLPGATTEPGPTRVAEFLTSLPQLPMTPKALTGHLGDTKGTMPPEGTAAEYGRMPPWVTQDRAKDVGVNEAVLPDVGEAFATMSIGERSERPSLDYTRERSLDWLKLVAVEQMNAIKVKLGRMRQEEAEEALREYAKQFAHNVDEPWSWHFAGVVARSDGDTVTLENYNRDPDIKKAMVAAYREAERNHTARMNEYKASLEHGGKTVEQILQDDPSFPSYAVQGLNKELIAKGQAAILQAPQPSGLWYFQMYGSKAGQTFHEASVRSGDFTNPLTIRWRDALTDEFCTERKDRLDAKALQLRARHRRDPARTHLETRMPPIVTQAKSELDQAQTKQEASEIYRQAAAQLDRLDGVLISLSI